MIKIDSITPTKNSKIVKIECTEVVSALDAARGFGSAKKHWITADADNHTFKVGQTFPVKIKMVMHDAPQYEGHKPFEKNGMFYTSELA